MQEQNQNSESGKPMGHQHVGPHGIAVADREMIGRALAGAIGLPESLAARSFDSWQRPDQRYGQYAEFVRGWAAGVPEARLTDKGHSLVLAGPPLSGKSHMAVSALRELATVHGLRCQFKDSSLIMADFRGAWSSRDLRVYLEPEVLMIDDLGTVRGKEGQREGIRLILAQRLARRRPTILTACWPLLSVRAEGFLGSALTTRMRAAYHHAELNLPRYPGV